MILRALLVSMFCHAVFIGVGEIGYRAGWWNSSLWNVLTHSASPADEKSWNSKNQTHISKLLTQEEETLQLTFVEVDPRSVPADPPKNAKFYSSASSKAANPVAAQADSQNPKIDGTQKSVPKTITAVKVEPISSDPRTQLATPTQPTLQPQPKPISTEAQVNPGNLNPEKLNPTPLQPLIEGAPNIQLPSSRPRTLAQAKANKGIIEGAAMQLDGGVRRMALDSSLDVKGSPFGAYDAAFIAAVQSRWYTLLDQRDMVRNQTGKVVIDFRLNKDGRIIDLNIATTEVSETLGWICQRAILDPAPYAAFPSDLRRLLNSDLRDVRFTFFYN